MKKAIYYGIKDLRVEEVPEPKPGPGEVKVRVKYCGICGSDLHEYLHGPFPQSPFGHEACGLIVEVGPGSNGFSSGGRRSWPFKKDAYAQYLICPQERLFKKPSSMSWERAAVVEPLAGAAYAIDRGGVQAEDTVLITGAGPVGLMALLGLKALGVKTVYQTDISEVRRQKAKEMGATWVFNPAEEKIPQKIKELTGGQGVDKAIEAVGVEASLKDCLASVRFQGTVIVQGIFTERVPMHMLGFVTRETTMIGTNSIHPVLAMAWIEKGGVEPEKMITRILPLEDIREGFEALTRKTKEEIKILIAP